MTRATLQLGGNVKAGHLWHFYISDKNVRLVGEHGLQRFLAGASAGNDGDIAFNLKKRGQSSQHHALIFCEGDPNRLTTFLSRGIQWPPFPVAAARGNRMVSLVPEEI